MTPAASPSHGGLRVAPETTDHRETEMSEQTEADIADIVAGALGTSRANAYSLMQDALNARSEAVGEREAFEAWCVTHGWVERPSARENGTYVNGSLQARWLGWQARAALGSAA